MELSSQKNMPTKIGRGLGLLLLTFILLLVLMLFVVFFNDASEFYVKWRRLFPTEADFLLKTRVALYTIFAPGPFIGVVAIALIRFTRGWQTFSYGMLLAAVFLFHVYICFLFGSAIFVTTFHQLLEAFLTWKIISYLKSEYENKHESTRDPARQT